MRKSSKSEVAKSPIDLKPNQAEVREVTSKPTTDEGEKAGVAALAAGAPPSNTAPSNYIQENNFKIVHQGTDSLYLSFQGSLSPEWAKKLTRLKILAQDSEPTISATAQVKIGEHIFEVSSRGRGKFMFVLRDNWFHIQVAGLDAHALPVAYVQISSELLTFRSPNEVVSSIRHIVNTITARVLSVSISRVDVCVDFMTDEDLSIITENDWVTRAKSFSRYSENGRFTGWSIELTP